MKLNKKLSLITREQEKAVEKVRIEEALMSLQREKHERQKKLDQHKEGLDFVLSQKMASISNEK